MGDYGVAALAGMDHTVMPNVSPMRHAAASSFPGVGPKSAIKAWQGVTPMGSCAMTRGAWGVAKTTRYEGIGSV